MLTTATPAAKPRTDIHLPLLPLLLISTLSILSTLSTPSTASAQTPPPHLQKQGIATQLIVEGKPFIMLAGELHNSSASSLEYMQPIWDKLVTLNLNTVLATISWELTEPEEGKFDFSLIDGLVADARQHNLKLVFLWFGSWKNGVSSYAPAWVKKDTQRFPRALGKSNQNKKDLITPLSDANCEADARAFAAVMKHIRQIDEAKQTVIMMQVENEVGIRPETRDLSPLGDAAYKAPVPAELITYLKNHKETLLPEVKDRWAAGGFKEAGAWSEVFGEGIETDEIFMAWHYARYIGKVAQAGKDAYPIPMYVNAWLEGDGKPSVYPCGGPVSRVMDVWRAAAPAIDFFAPDIYLPDFKGICARYTRSGNPLMIPEASRDEHAAGKAFWAYAEHSALCFSPFGIESLDTSSPLVEVYGLLSPLVPLMAQAQGLGKMVGVFQQPGEKDEGRTVNVGDWRADIRYEKESKGRRAMGMIIAGAEDEYFVAGIGFSVHFSPLKPGPRNGAILQIQEGRFENGKWIAGRVLNGDESGANNVARIPPFPGDTYSNPGKLRLLRAKLYRFD